MRLGCRVVCPFQQAHADAHLYKVALNEPAGAMIQNEYQAVSGERGQLIITTATPIKPKSDVVLFLQEQSGRLMQSILMHSFS